VADRIDPQPHQHSPGAPTARDCRLCATLKHPGQAAEGRKLTAHLKSNPLPRQAVASV
jgi:hypothetical protein